MFTGLLENIEKPPNSLKKKFLSIVLKTSKVEQCRDGKCIKSFFTFKVRIAMTTTRKRTTLKRKWITQNTDLYSWKKKLKVTIELNGIGGMYTVKAKQRQTSKKNNKKTIIKVLILFFLFPFFFFPFPFPPKHFHISLLYPFCL